MRDLRIAIMFGLIMAALLIAFLSSGALDIYGEYKCELCRGDLDFAGVAIYCE